MQILISTQIHRNHREPCLAIQPWKDLLPELRSRQKAACGCCYRLTVHHVFCQRGRIAGAAEKPRMPTISADTGYVDMSSLIAYGPSFPDMYRCAVTYVDKILKGIKPADLPVEQPTKFEFINLKTAKQIRLTIPTQCVGKSE